MAVTQTNKTTTQILKDRVFAIRPVLLQSRTRDEVLAELAKRLEGQRTDEEILRTWRLRNGDIVIVEAMEALAAENENAKNQKK